MIEHFVGYLQFQSPYGGIGASDLITVLPAIMLPSGFNHLTVAGVGQTSKYIKFYMYRKEGFNHLAVAGVGQTGVHKQ